jgi:CDP-paratose 2-epimerase
LSVAIVTGSAGLIGSESVRQFAREGLDVVGVDNDLRRHFFGDDASTRWNLAVIEGQVPSYEHHDFDIRDREAVDRLFAHFGRDVAVVVHTAAQPSHDWAARAPFDDFSINATGTLNLLEATRAHCPEAPFIFTSTNKVYGDTPNRLPLVALEARYELQPGHRYAERGIDESMSIDASTHSLFGVSKTAADLLVQEYGRYFGMPTAAFRAGCLTGPDHSAAELHGFLAYLFECTALGRPYTVIGYDGKQVRDNIHARDLVSAFRHFFRAPRVAEVYNIGGGRHANCSMREAIALAEELFGRPLDWSYRPESRVGDHVWWISDVSKFQAHYPDWRYEYDLRRIAEDLADALRD